VPSVTVATSNTIKYPQAGHVWVYLNWALSWQARGYDVTWLDMVQADDDVSKLQEQFDKLAVHLQPFGLGESILIVDHEGKPHDRLRDRPMTGLGGDVLFNLRYNLPNDFPKQFRHSALLDTDPGMVQYAIRHGQMKLAAHDAYFTVGNGIFDSDLVRTGTTWHPLLPAVALDHWPQSPVPAGSWSTVTHWYMDVWMVDADGSAYMNDKRTAFEPYLNLPKTTGESMTLAANLNDDPQEQQRLEALGWRVRESHDVGKTLSGYRDFITQSRGEFSCCKPSYRRLNTGWISDRTACYLAAGRPCVVEWSGDRGPMDGLLRFKSSDEATAMLRQVASDPQHFGDAARRLAEKHFDGRLGVDRVLDHLP
jgi:hypothetical protein